MGKSDEEKKIKVKRAAGGGVPPESDIPRCRFTCSRALRERMR